MPPVRQWPAFVRSRLKGRADSEHEMTLNRLILNSIVFLYLIIAGRSGMAEAYEVFGLTNLLFVGYNVFSLGLFAHILYQPGISRFRRCFAIFLDLGMISYVSYVGGGVTAFLYPLFLWTIFGNGFRFGLPYLALSMAVGVASFSCVILLSPFWRLHATLAFGLLAGLVMLPLYVGVLIRKLSEAKRQAEQANAAKSLFLASVSHELRTPLTAIIGLSDLLQDHSLDREQREMAHTIGSSGRTLLRQINSLLDFSRAEIEKLPLECTTIDLHALLAETRDMLAIEARSKGLQLALHIAAATPRHIIASQRHLQEALLNLTSNAVKFTETGHVLISAGVALVAGKRVVLAFEVSDTGIGIAEEAQSRIFETFTQADATIIDRFGGTGLGLAIARQLVRAQKGQISVHSQLGQGSRFSFEIEAELAAGPDTAVRALPMSGRTILLCTDDQLFKADIERLAGPVACASTGEEVSAFIAVAAQERTKKPVLFLDAQILGDGLEAFAAKIASGSLADQVLMIALLPGDDTAIVSAAGRRLFATCLPRPWKEEMLANALDMAGYAPAPRRRRDDGAGAIATQAGSRRILLAEDNRTNQKVIARILEKAGHQVEVVNDGEAALDALANGTFHLVLMDINMPVMNGIEATKFYHFTEINGPHVPIIALTADASEANQQKCRDAGMIACLMKPVDTASLLAAIQSLATPAGAGKLEPGNSAPAGPLHPFGIAPARAGIVDEAVLAELEALGGPDFVREIVAQFSEDAASVLRGLVAAIASRDADSFRNSAHALRSCAANVGAQKIYATCLEWRDIGTEELTRNGSGFLARLESELQQAQAALEAYRNHPAPGTDCRVAVQEAGTSARSA